MSAHETLITHCPMSDSRQVVAEEAQRALKDLIFQAWAAAGCESRADTLKMVRPTRQGN